MTVTHENKYFKIEVDNTNKLLVDTWFETTRTMTENEFKEQLKIFQSNMLAHQIHHALTDTRNFLFPMTPDVQAWTLDNITRPLKAAGYYQRHAFLAPHEVVASLALEMWADDNLAVADTRYFDDMDEALAWLQQS